MKSKIPFYNLRSTHLEQHEELQQAFLEVLMDNWFVLGKQLERFEAAFGKFIGTRYALGTGNGYDALKIALSALDLRPGDGVIVPAHTFTATFLAIMHAGLRPVLIDINENDYTLDPNLLEDLEPKGIRAILPVHMYGHVCDMEAILSYAHHHELHIIEDYAQSTGASFRGRRTGAMGTINATSFYPVKTLGALGDGGMITTNDKGLYEKVKQLRNYGFADKFNQERAGFNSRLDEIQAALLSVKLKKLDHFIRERQTIAGKYIGRLSGLDNLKLPQYGSCQPAFHIFPVLTERRDALKKFLFEKGIETMVHYPIPAYLQPALRSLGYEKGAFPVTERIANTEISLPVYPGLSPAEVDFIADQILDFLKD